MSLEERSLTAHIYIALLTGELKLSVAHRGFGKDPKGRVELPREVTHLHKSLALNIAQEYVRVGVWLRLRTL